MIGRSRWSKTHQDPGQAQLGLDNAAAGATCPPQPDSRTRSDRPRSPPERVSTPGPRSLWSRQAISSGGCPPIEEKADELARLETLDNGKPLGESPGRRPAAEHRVLFAVLRRLGRRRSRARRSRRRTALRTTCYTRREPVGVVGPIIPWNFPLLMRGVEAGPGAGGGQHRGAEAAEQTPLTALRLAGCSPEVGLPARRAQRGHRATARRRARRWPEHPDVDKIAFTGETGTGRQIMDAAARQPEAR